MSQLPCKRFWEGPVGVALMPRKQQNGEYFWTFAFTRAFRRQGKDTWEYTEFFGQKHAASLGKVMSRAIHFMEQNRPEQFVENWMAKQEAETAEQPAPSASPPPANASDDLATASLPPAASAVN